GVALDLSADAFPVGACTRTVFEKAEIVLWRTDPGRFHVEVWRSFAPYLVELLDVVRRQDAAAP
ncbi:MAG: sarcosine oxidase subunit gamma, partial [Hyphomicrobiales bacterium]|nr:sarcosine oxidase subunit gamma [Hyphomicrobiales bacterium]